MASVSPVALPDFRNLGVMLRIALLAEAMRLVTTYTAAAGLVETYRQFTSQGLIFEPTLLSSLAILFAVAPALQRAGYREGVVFILALTSSLAVAWHLGLNTLLPGAVPGSLFRSAVLAALVTAAILFYFNWRHRTLSPALAESRLAALQARIRPHFLYNSLNSVLGLIRDDPRRAEAMLEDLADLFRALMADTRHLVPFGRELELARAYAEIEGIRLGPRLRLHWHCDSAPADALVPPLILQPLVENAVLHGVEPFEAGAEISVEAFEDAGRLEIFVRNPCPHQTPPREGNRLALANIAERLALHFDAEARLKAYKADGEFVVHIRLPIRRKARDEDSDRR